MATSIKYARLAANQRDIQALHDEATATLARGEEWARPQVAMLGAVLGEIAAAMAVERAREKVTT